MPALTSTSEPADLRRRRSNGQIALAVLAISAALLTLWSHPSAAASATRVKRDQSTRVFVMAGFTPECAFKGFPDMELQSAPAKGQIAFKTGEATTIQYSLSGKCLGSQVEGTGIYYTPTAGQAGEDSFTVIGRLGSGEPATRTFSVIIDENGNEE